MDRRGKSAAGRGHRHVRRVGPEAAGAARTHQETVPSDSDDAGFADEVPQGGRVRGHASTAVRRPEHDGRSFLGWRHPTAGRDGQVDGLPGGVLRQGPVPVRQVQAVLPGVPGHVRVHAAVDGHVARDVGLAEPVPRRIHRPEVSCSGSSNVTAPHCMARNSKKGPGRVQGMISGVRTARDLVLLFKLWLRFHKMSDFDSFR